jgi:hypothetical protein
MNRSLMLPFAALVVALSSAAPAGAISGAGIPATLDVPKVTAVADGKSSAKTHTCQAGDTKEKVRARSAIAGSARKTAVVACEQPPRSQLLGPGLKQAAANVLSALG